MLQQHVARRPFPSVTAAKPVMDGRDGKLPQLSDMPRIHAPDSNVADKGAAHHIGLRIRLRRKFSALRRMATNLQQFKLLRLAFLVLFVLTIVALSVDGGLFALFIQRQNQGPALATPPMLTLTPTVVHPEQVVLIHISHFPALARVLVTRDIGEPARLDQSSSFVQVDRSGAANVRMLIDDAWGLGTHYVDSEDVSTHYTASTVVQVVSTKQERPPSLSLDQHVIDMGTDYIGSTTLQQVTLSNMGGGAINWMASSDQPWLLTTPEGGSFNTRQPLTLAVSRAHMLPGHYQSTVTFTSNAGSTLRIHVTMAVLTLPATVGGVLSVTPPALSFATFDSGADPAQQTLTISNPGTRPLHWSLKALTPTFASDQNIPLVPQSPWLDAQPATGDIAPAMTATVRVFTHSQHLLPGSYSGGFSFTSGSDVLNTPQPIAVSLSILPRCSPALSLSALSLTGFAGQEQAAQQNVSVSLPASCSVPLSWQAISLSPWLSLAPSRGVVYNSGSMYASVQVNSEHLLPGSYTGSIIFASPQRTQTVPIQFTVLSAAAVHATAVTGSHSTSAIPHSGMGPVRMPTSGARPDPGSETPVPGTTTGGGSTAHTMGTALSVSGANLTFNVGQGQNGAPQILTVTNQSSVPVTWQATPDAQGLLSLSQGSNTLAAGQSDQIVVQSVTSSLSIGSYNASILLSASDSSGHALVVASRSVSVAITIGPPCVVQVSPGSLYFPGSIAQGTSYEQTMTVQRSGSCAGPVTWTASVGSSDISWLSLQNNSGVVDSNGESIGVFVSNQNVLPGWKHGFVAISAVDGNGNTVTVDNQTVSVTLNASLQISSS
ncbi:hypothetical protein ccbrp13_35470 [Ktedonobacteria bacterium brp13]|nr:hypothetical protein ccbrp13_35470 [Ktedonobacteria bacterium brp13]